MNKNILIVLVLSIFLVTAYWQVTHSNEISPKQETVYVNSIFGCVQLKDKYTPEQWNAAQEFNQKVLGYKLLRCN